jgi:hypothetical protein
MVGLVMAAIGAASVIVAPESVQAVGTAVVGGGPNGDLGGGCDAFMCGTNHNQVLV